MTDQTDFRTLLYDLLADDNGEVAWMPTACAIHAAVDTGISERGVYNNLRNWAHPNNADKGPPRDPSWLFDWVRTAHPDRYEQLHAAWKQAERERVAAARGHGKHGAAATVRATSTGPRARLDATLLLDDDGARLTVLPFDQLPRQLLGIPELPGFGGHIDRSCDDDVAGHIRLARDNPFDDRRLVTVVAGGTVAQRPAGATHAALHAIAQVCVGDDLLVIDHCGSPDTLFTFGQALRTWLESKAVNGLHDNQRGRRRVVFIDDVHRALDGVDLGQLLDGIETLDAEQDGSTHNQLIEGKPLVVVTVPADVLDPDVNQPGLQPATAALLRDTAVPVPAEFDPVDKLDLLDTGHLDDLPYVLQRATADDRVDQLVRQLQGPHRPVAGALFDALVLASHAGGLPWDDIETLARAAHLRRTRLTVEPARLRREMTQLADTVPPVAVTLATDPAPLWTLGPAVRIPTEAVDGQDAAALDEDGLSRLVHGLVAHGHAETCAAVLTEQPVGPDGGRSRSEQEVRADAAARQLLDVLASDRPISAGQVEATATVVAQLSVIAHGYEDALDQAQAAARAGRPRLWAVAAAMALSRTREQLWAMEPDTAPDELPPRRDDYDDEERFYLMHSVWSERNGFSEDRHDDVVPDFETAVAALKAGVDADAVCLWRLVGDLLANRDDIESSFVHEATDDVSAAAVAAYTAAARHGDGLAALRLAALPLRPLLTSFDRFFAYHSTKPVQTRLDPVATLAAASTLEALAADATLDGVPVWLPWLLVAAATAHLGDTDRTSRHVRRALQAGLPATSSRRTSSLSRDTHRSDFLDEIDTPVDWLLRLLPEDVDPGVVRALADRLPSAYQRAQVLFDLDGADTTPDGLARLKRLASRGQPYSVRYAVALLKAGLSGPLRTAMQELAPSPNRNEPDYVQAWSLEALVLTGAAVQAGVDPELLQAAAQGATDRLDDADLVRLVGIAAADPEYVGINIDMTLDGLEIVDQQLARILRISVLTDPLAAPDEAPEDVAAALDELIAAVEELPGGLAAAQQRLAELRPTPPQPDVSDPSADPGDGDVPEPPNDL